MESKDSADKAKSDYPLHWMIWWNHKDELKQSLENKSVRYLLFSLLISPFVYQYCPPASNCSTTWRKWTRVDVRLYTWLSVSVVLHV